MKAPKSREVAMSDKIKVIEYEDLKDCLSSYDIIVSNDDEYLTSVKIKGYKGTLIVVFLPFDQENPARARVHVAFEEEE